MTEKLENESKSLKKLMQFLTDDVDLVKTNVIYNKIFLIF